MEYGDWRETGGRYSFNLELILLFFISLLGKLPLYIPYLSNSITPFTLTTTVYCYFTVFEPVYHISERLRKAMGRTCVFFYLLHDIAVEI